jgi:hypothetical protein
MRKLLLCLLIAASLFVYGCSGDDGSDGVQGVVGEQGEAGAPGAAGIQGPVGPAGPQGEQGEPGPTGPAGPQGVQGTAGSDGATYVLAAPVYSADVSVAISSNVVFNSVLYSAGNVSYNSITGIVTFNVTGRYIVNWNVSTDGLIGPINTATADVSFALISSQGDNIASAGLLSTGQISGFGIIDVVAAPVTMSLVNDSSNAVQLADVTPKANLMINSSDGAVSLLVSRN